MTESNLSLNTSTQSQREYIKQALRKRPHSTFDFRMAGICSPAPRIMELRKLGYEIITTFTREPDQSGVMHSNIAVYELLSEPNQATNKRTTSEEQND